MWVDFLNCKVGIGYVLIVVQDYFCILFCKQESCGVFNVMVGVGNQCVFFSKWFGYDFVFVWLCLVLDLVSFLLILKEKLLGFIGGLQFSFVVGVILVDVW